MTNVALQPILRGLNPGDRGRIEAITRATGVFRDDEVQVALEVFDASVHPGQSDYFTLGAEVSGRLAGWICWGQTPCTEGTWDLYWMAVDPTVQGSGIGSALVSAMEQRVASAARLIMIDTSGRGDYAATRAFYQSRGYSIAAVIPDFYAPGDDQVIFAKPLVA
ncbi:MAG TPA: GNAT family N-acetyltransferase [Gemmatimonadales bacterium]|nr:GNAT family N-acetyltransferase [Gemmatimonadales bacterium]